LGTEAKPFLGQERGLLSWTRVLEGGAVIEVRDLVKRYRKARTNAIDGVSFEVSQG